MFPAKNNSTIPDITENNYKDFNWHPGLPQCYTQNGAVNAYLPELLQDNSNVKALYPGENQDTFYLDLSSYKTLATIPCDSINFNETFANLDSRASLINSTAAFPSDLLSIMSVVPVLRGPRQLFKNLTDTPYDNCVTNVSQDSDLSKILWSEILQSKNNMTHDNCFTKSLPQKFIKCLPILAQDDNGVNHTICATITWTLEIETTERLYKNINPLKWEMLWPMRYGIPTVENGKLTGVTWQETMISSQGLRPLNDEHYRQLQLRRRGGR